MNQFKKHQTKKVVSSVDGMIGGSASASPGFTPNRSAAPQGRITASRPSQNRLDDFRRKDGFRSNQQPTIEQSAAPDKPRPLGRSPVRNADGVIDLSLTPGPRKPKRPMWRKVLSKRTFVGTFVFIFLIIGFLFGKGFWNFNKILQGGGGAAALQSNVDPTKLNGEGDGRINILLLGKGGEGHTAPDLTDTLLLASIDPINHKASLLSVPRDLWVTAEGQGAGKINAVYANGKSAARYQGETDKQKIEDAGLSAIDKTVATTLGIPIHYHVMVDFKAFKQAVDTVNGVDLNIDENGTVYEQLWDESTGQNFLLNVTKGPQHFNGQRALFYARSRYTSPRGDFDRTERQRKLILALKGRVLSLGTFANPLKISGLISAFGDNVRANMTKEEVMRLYDITKDINDGDVASIGLADPPNPLVTTGNVNGQSIVQPRLGLTDFSAIQAYVRNALRDGFLANEDAKVLILNGTTTAGLATQKSTELKSFGYKVLKVGDAPTKDYTTTQLIDLRNGEKKYTQHYLEQRLNVKATNQLPTGITPGEADFVIILGSN